MPRSPRQQLHARAKHHDLLDPLTDTSTTPSPSPSPPSSPNAQPSSSTTTTSPTPKHPDTPTTPTTTTTPPASDPPSTPTTTTTTAPKTTPTSSSTSSPSSASTSPSTSPVSSPSTTPVDQPLTTLTANPETLTLTTPNTIDPSTSYPVVNVTPSPSSTGSSGSGSGRIVGGVFGAFAAVALIAVIVAFFLRRWRRNRTTDEDFSPDDFAVPPPNLSNPEFTRSSTFDPNPPSMTQLTGHHLNSSISSGPGMAGQGAYASHALQERQAYTYGQSYELTDEGNGPYSSEPHAEVPYNSEAYAYYDQTAYSPPHTSPFDTPYQTPALVPGASSVPASRGAHPSNRSVFEERDAYGGI